MVINHVVAARRPGTRTQRRPSRANFATRHRAAFQSPPSRLQWARFSRGRASGHGMARGGRYRRHVHGRGADRRCDAGRSASPRCPPRRATSREGVLAALEMAMRRYGLAAADVGLLSHATTVVTNAILRGEGRARRADHHARLPRRAGAAALGARRPLRPVPGRAGHADPAPAPVRDHRAHRRRRRGRHAAGRGRDRRPDRGAEGRAGAGGGRLAAVQLPQPGARAAAGRAAARGAARTCPSTCPRRCCPRSRSSSAPARRRCAPTSGRSWPPTWSGWRAPRARRACRALYVMGSSGGVLEAAEAVAMPAMAVESGPGGGRGGGGARGAADRPAATCSPSTWAAPPPRPA